MHISHHKAISLRNTDRSRRQHGYILTMFALLLVPLLLMVGFAVDVGYWYNRASDMRRAADAAALAGVVWLPDEAAATTAALAAAAKNGFVPSANVSISVKPSTRSPRRLEVSITDNRVGSFFYKSLGGNNITLTRTSYAEYVLPVPMGSPRNFFGTGVLFDNYTGTGIPTEYLYQSVNPYCTDKVNGDRHQSGHFNDVATGTCTNNVNTEFRPDGYELYIEAPQGRTEAIEVRLYDPRYNEDTYTWTEPGADNCQTVPVYSPADPGWVGPASTSANVEVWGPAQYRTYSSGNWGGLQTLNTGQSLSHRGDRLVYRTATTFEANWQTWTTTSNRTISGPGIYQTRATDTSSTWSSSTWLSAGSSFTERGARLRFNPATIATTIQCTPTVITHNEAGVDDERQQGTDDYTFELYGADNTPLNDNDNPLICTKTFSQNSLFDGYSYLGSVRWNTLCTIAASDTDGRYILKVRNSAAISNPINDGSNQWGIVAKYSGSGDNLCDGRNDNMCPRVYGKDSISVRAAATTQVASFYLAEIAAEHAGKKLKLELWDPGEGGSTIEIMRPSGTDGNTWTPATFSWSGNARGGYPTSGTSTSMSVANSRWNGRLVSIEVDLSGYNPPTNNNWWQIRYTFSGKVTDRTTWSARIVGDPVHLVEEN